MRRSPWRPPVRIGDVVPAAFQRWGLEKQFRQSEIWGVWPKVVGPQIARHAQPHAIKQGRLIVHVTDPVWLHHLSMMRHRLIASLNERLDTIAVREIVLRVGEVPTSTADPPPLSGRIQDPPPEPSRITWIETLLAPLGESPFYESLYRLLCRACRRSDGISSR